MTTWFSWQGQTMYETGFPEDHMDSSPATRDWNFGKRPSQCLCLSTVDVFIICKADILPAPRETSAGRLAMTGRCFADHRLGRERQGPRDCPDCPAYGRPSSDPGRASAT